MQRDQVVEGAIGSRKRSCIPSGVIPAPMGAGLIVMLSEGDGVCRAQRRWAGAWSSEQTQLCSGEMMAGCKRSGGGWPSAARAAQGVSAAGVAQQSGQAADQGMQAAHPAGHPWPVRSLSARSASIKAILPSAPSASSSTDHLRKASLSIR